MEKTSGEQHLHYSDSEGGLKVVAAHEVDHLLQKAAELLNGHWKQGEEVLEKSCDTFPLHLLLVDAEENVLAHSKLSHVDSHNGQGEAALIESVIVDPTLRGKGLGRIIMEATEKAAIERHCFTLYLSTADKQEFYRHLGFTECEPVTSLGSNAKQISSAQLSALARIFGGQGGPVLLVSLAFCKRCTFYFGTCSLFFALPILCFRLRLCCVQTETRHQPNLDEKSATELEPCKSKVLTEVSPSVLSSSPSRFSHACCWSSDRSPLVREGRRHVGPVPVRHWREQCASLS